MAIDPLVIVDDDGSGTVGTVFNAALVTQLEANIDAAIDGAGASVRSVALGGTGASTLTGILQGNGASAVTAITLPADAAQYLDGTGAFSTPAGGAGAAWIEQTTSSTGTQNNFDLDGSQTVLRCTGAAPNFSGFTVDGSAPAAGDQVLILCLGTTAKVAHQSGSSTEANRVICPSTAGQIVGLNGAMLLVYDDTTDRWREVLLTPGNPIAHTFDAADYTGNGSMTWTVASGDVVVDLYQQIGKQLTVWFTANTTTVGGTLNTTLRKKIPGAFSAASGLWQAPFFVFFDNNASKSVRVSINTADDATLIRFATLDGSNFAAATDTTYAYLHDWTFGID